jgi:hypothetical protein
MSRIKRPAARASLATAFAGFMLADLSMVPFEVSPIPLMPGVYRDLTHRDPETTILDAPLFGSNEGQVFSSLWGYWQSIHEARTSAGYPGLPNVPFEAEVVRPSPFWAGRLVDPAYLSNSRLEDFGPAKGVDPRDYAWLYLTAHRFDHVVLHQGMWSDPKYAEGGVRIKALLAEAKVFEDADVAVFNLEQLRPPGHLTWLCAEGFRPALARREPGSFGVLREARLAIFNPTPERQIVLNLVDASAFARARSVRLLHGGREIVRWIVEPGVATTLKTPPFGPGDGVQELRLECDGDDRPTRYADRIDDARTPYSLRLDGVRVRFAEERDR